VTIVNVGLPTAGVAGYTVTAVTTGSGVVIDPSGLVVTNNHVIQRADALHVYFADGTQRDGTVVGADSVADLALVRVDGPPPAAIPLGDSSRLELGQTVIAIGSPLEAFRGSTTVGVVSGLNRTVGGMGGLIQTDALINYGDSGGPLVNAAGEVVGINTLVVRTTGDGKLLEGLGFAIPANQVRRVVMQLLSGAGFGTRYLGVGFREVDWQLARALNLEKVAGVLVTQVEAGSLAAEAGLQQRDVIVQVDGKQIDNNHLFPDALSRSEPGDSVTLTVRRGTKQLKIEMPLKSSPD
jgi:2-alkenal reductase